MTTLLPQDAERLTIFRAFDSWEALRMEQNQDDHGPEASPTTESGRSSQDPSSSQLSPGSNLATFPPGFRRLAVNGELSKATMNYLEALFPWMHDRSRSQRFVPEPRHEILITDLSTTEKLLVIALQVYLNHFMRLNQHPVDDTSELSVYLTIKPLLQDHFMPECHEDALTWSLIMLATALPPETDSWLRANRALERKAVTKAKRKELGRSFLPFPDFSLSRRFQENSQPGCDSLAVRLLELDVRHRTQNPQFTDAVELACR
jgi:hypothetical protein